jgi:hypothetical protein
MPKRNAQTKSKTKSKKGSENDDDDFEPSKKKSKKKSKKGSKKKTKETPTASARSTPGSLAKITDDGKISDASLLDPRLQNVPPGFKIHPGYPGMPGLVRRLESMKIYSTDNNRVDFNHPNMAHAASYADIPRPTTPNRHANAHNYIEGVFGIYDHWNNASGEFMTGLPCFSKLNWRYNVDDNEKLPMDRATGCTDFAKIKFECAPSNSEWEPLPVGEPVVMMRNFSKEFNPSDPTSYSVSSSLCKSLFYV